MRPTTPSRSSGPGVFRAPSLVPWRRRPFLLSKGTGATTLGRITETGTARGLTFYRATALGRITETGTARTITTYRLLEAAVITETGSARALSFASVPSGEVLEPQLIIEVAFAVGASTGQYLTIGDTTRGLIGTGLIAPNGIGALGGVWTDVTAYMRSWSVSRTSTRTGSALVTYEPGTATIVLDNTDRRFDPTNLDGPYADGNQTQVTPMRAVRIRAIWDDVEYPIFHGFADRWDVAWFDPGYAEATLTATDAMKVLRRIQRTAAAVAGAGELTGPRMTRILDSAEWGDADRDLDTGTVTLIDSSGEGDPWTEMQLVADTEIGDLFVDPAGRVVFKDRAARTGDSASALSQATFGDEDDDLPYKALTISYDDSAFFNQVKATRAPASEVDTPVEQVANDATSQALYLISTYDRTDLVMQTDAQAATWASYVLSRSSQPELRFDEVTIEPLVQPADLLPQVLGRQFRDRITIRRSPPGGGARIERMSWIRGVEHQGKQGEWSTTWELQQADDGRAPAPALMDRSALLKRRVVAHRRDKRVRARRYRMANPPGARR